MVRWLMRTPWRPFCLLDFDQIQRLHFFQQPHHFLGLDATPPGLKPRRHPFAKQTQFSFHALFLPELSVLASSEEALHLDRCLIFCPHMDGSHQSVSITVSIYNTLDNHPWTSASSPSCPCRMRPSKAVNQDDSVPWLTCCISRFSRSAVSATPTQRST